MVKKFRRAAAGLEEQLPSDLRPPEVLRATCDYLFNDMIGHARSLASVHHFVWDRTRAIRNDFSIQQITKPEDLRIAIECYERIARFHILSLHQLALPEKPYSKYDWQQEREQLDRTLLSLMQYYDDSRGRVALSNEAEFRAYCVVFQLQDPTPDLEDRVQSWPVSIVQDRRVQKAVDLYMAACNVMDAQGPLKPRANHLIARQDWRRFWTLISSKEVSYLMACVAEIYFNLVRRTVLNALFRTSRANSSIATTEWTVGVLCDLLAFDDVDDVYTYCERFGFTFREREDGEQHLDLTSVKGRTLPEPTAGMSKQSKTGLVENKRFGRTLPAVINGMSVGRAQEAGLVIGDEQDESMGDEVEGDNHGAILTNGKAHASSEATDDGESLFIPESKRPSAVQPPSSTPLFNGFNVSVPATPSIFSGLNSTSTFGRPSNSSQPLSVFAPAPKPAESTQIPDFLRPATTTSTVPSSSDPLFNFSGISSSAKQEGTVPRTFSFGQPSSVQSSIPTSAPDSGVGKETSAFQFGSMTPQEKASPRFTADNGSQDHPKKQADFGSFPSAGASGSTPSFSTRQSGTPSSQPHFTVPPASPTTHATSPTNTISGAKRSSFSVDTKPKKPSPLSNSFSANDSSSSAIADEPSATRSEVQPVEDSKQYPYGQVSEAASAKAKETTRHPRKDVTEDLESNIARVANEIFEDPVRGYLQYYVKWAVSEAITGVQQQLTTERLNAEADDYRQFRLHEKYGRRWRDIFWRQRLAKTGRERRQRRQRRLHHGGSQGPDDSSLIDSESLFGSSRPVSVAESRSGDLRNKRDMVDTMFQQTVNGNRWSRPSSSGSKRPISSHGTHSSVVPRESGHKRLKSTSHVDPHGRIAKPSTTSSAHADILKRSSFLGFSAASNAINNKSTTKSNYFRLKAMGINGATDLSTPRGTKRRLSESLQESTRTTPASVLARSPHGSSPLLSTSQVMKVQPSSAPPRTRKTSDDDEALFARLKAARDNLQDNETYVHSKLGEHDKPGANIGGSQSSMESPSMARARAEARLRVSKGGSAAGAGNFGHDGPAYRMRESKFVPREQYGKAIERAKELRESRSRDTSRPESRVEPSATQPMQELPASPNQSKRNEFELRKTDEVSHTREPNSTWDTTDNEAHSFAFPRPSHSFSSFVPQATISFADHNTQTPAANPFLSSNTQGAFSGFGEQSTFGSTAFALEPHNHSIRPSQISQSFAGGSQDRTIQPSQIGRSLADTLGTSHPFGQNDFQQLSQYNPISAQQDSYLQSQAVSLLSDDKDETPNDLGAYQLSHNAVVTENPADELLDEPTDDEQPLNSYGHANPYAALAEESEDETDGRGFDSQVEDEEDYDDGLDEVPNGYADDEAEDREAVDGDIDEDETEGLSGSEGYGYDYEDESGDESDAQPRVWQQQAYGIPWNAKPEPNSALQDVGNTAEEAIELSD